MPATAVVAHAGKSFGGGLSELREALAREGITDPLWYEVTKSRKAPIKICVPNQAAGCSRTLVQPSSRRSNRA